MNDFTQQLVQWQWFYATVATSAATLMGLLFVSLSVNRKSATRPSGGYLHTAQQSFGDFLYVFMIGLVFLVPHQAPFGLAVALFALGAARTAGVIRHWRHGGSSVSRDKRFSASLREYGLPLVATLGLLFVAVEILMGNTDSIFGLVAVIAALLATASWNAWLLLIMDSPESL